MVHSKADALICNRDEHWFTIRKLEGHFFNLNSLNKAPEYISDFYLRYTTLDDDIRATSVGARLIKTPFLCPCGCGRTASVLIDTLVRSGFAIFVLLGSLPAAGHALELSCTFVDAQRLTRARTACQCRQHTLLRCWQLAARATGTICPLAAVAQFLSHTMSTMTLTKTTSYKPPFVPRSRTNQLPPPRRRRRSSFQSK